MVNKMKILVTGAGGFVGKHLIKELLKRNHKVVALGIGDNSALYEMGIPVYETNILDFNTVYKNIQKEQPEARSQDQFYQIRPASENRRKPSGTSIALCRKI